MVRKAEWIRRSVLTNILQSQERRCSELVYCGYKDELTSHINTAVNSYAPVRCMRMGAFCIAFRENFPSAMVTDLVFYVFLRRKGEKHYSEPTGHESLQIKSQEGICRKVKNQMRW